MLSFLFLMSAVFATTEINGPIIGRSQEEIMVILRHKDKKVFQNFLNDTPDIFTQKYKDGDTVVHLAVRAGNNVALRTLLKNGADLNGKNVLGETPAHVAVNCGNLEALLELKFNQANLEAVDNLGNTPLHLAVLKKKLSICVLLLEMKVNVDAQNKDLNTPLHLAMICRCDNISSLLEQFGASKKLKNNNGKIPIEERVFSGSEMWDISLAFLLLCGVPFMTGVIGTSFVYANISSKKPPKLVWSFANCRKSHESGELREDS